MKDPQNLNMQRRHRRLRAARTGLCERYLPEAREKYEFGFKQAKICSLKSELAALLKQTTSEPHGWIPQRLNRDTPDPVSRDVSEFGYTDDDG